MKLNQKIVKIFEDLNFEIDNNDNIALSKDNIINKAMNNVIQLAYKKFIENNEIKKCIEYYNDIHEKYIVENNTELKNLIQQIEADFFELDLNWIDTKNITDMSHLFANMTDSNYNISEWNTSNVEVMSYMFDCATKFNCDISSWNVCKVKDMSYMFYNARSFNQNICKWNVSNVENMTNMLSYAQSFNQDISNWNIKNVKYMNNMFEGAKSFNQDISNWNIGKDVDAYNMFKYCPIKEEYKPKLNN